MTHLFTYGSLMFSPVWQSIVRGNYEHQQALLPGYRRFEVAGETYPGIVAAPEDSVPGLLYRDVGAEDLQLLDDFEGMYYRRDAVTLLTESGNPVEAQTYIIRAEYAHLLTPKPWSPEAFGNDGIHRFMRHYGGFDAIH